jgi:glycosyltransferase involved in cell wall biosynthesis
MGSAPKNRVFIGFAADSNDLGGGNRVNRLCAEVLRSDFDEAQSPGEAALQAHSFNWKAPLRPRRLFIDHGSFADASFWAYVAPTLRASDSIIVSSSVCARVAERFIEADGPMILNVPFSVDLRQFRPADDRGANRDAVADELGIPRDGPWLLVVSGFVRRKNHHLAVHFLQILQKEVPSVRLIMVGATPTQPASLNFRAAVEELALSAGVGSSIHFVGHLSQARLSALMAAADLLVHLTNCRLENFGLVVAEAMAAGLPVVAADWGGLRDLVVPGRTGFLARTYLTGNGPRTDWRSLIRPACELLRNAAAWAEFSRNSRMHAEVHLSDEAFRRRFGAAVTSALTRTIAHDGSPVLTSPGAELRMRTISLNAMHPEIRDAGDEYRLLMNVDGGRHYRVLTGAAASSEYPPRVGRQARLYPLVGYGEEGAAIRIDDPAWPAVITADPARLEVLRSIDGTKTLEEILCEQPVPSVIGGDAFVRAAQALVDEGLLCPIDDAGDRPG